MDRTLDPVDLSSNNELPGRTCGDDTEARHPRNETKAIMALRGVIRTSGACEFVPPGVVSEWRRIQFVPVRSPVEEMLLQQRDESSLDFSGNRADGDDLFYSPVILTPNNYSSGAMRTNSSTVPN